MAKDAQAVVEKYARGLSGAAENYRVGVTSPKAPWKESAQSENAEKRYNAGVTRAAANKSRQKAVQKLTEADWRDPALNVGASALAASATKASEKYAKKVSTILSAGDAARNAAAQIPGTTIQERLQRAVAAGTAIHRAWAREKGVTPEV